MLFGRVLPRKWLFIRPCESMNWIIGQWMNSLAVKVVLYVSNGAQSTRNFNFVKIQRIFVSEMVQQAWRNFFFYIPLAFMLLLNAHVVSTHASLERKQSPETLSLVNISCQTFSSHLSIIPNTPILSTICWFWSISNLMELKKYIFIITPLLPFRSI